MKVYNISNNGEKNERENIHMYKIAANCSFIGGRKFDNLGDAIGYAKSRPEAIDVVRVSDNKVVYSVN